MPFKSEAQRKFLYATNPELAEKFEKIHNSPGYKKKMRGRKKMMTNPGGGFAAAAQRRLDAGNTPPVTGSRKAKPMASGRSIMMPTREGTKKIQAPGKGVPAFASAARRKIAAQRNSY